MLAPAVAGRGGSTVRRRAAALLLAGAAVLLLGGGAGAGEAGSPRVLVTEVTGTITPVVADHLADAVQEAVDERAEALVVELDTPGGLSTSMRDIVQTFLAADVPVVVYVSPSGGRAASAGALITFAANVAAMTPGTTIGAATPVSVQGGEVGDKVVNDAASFAEAVAEERGRNTEFAVQTVRQGRSVTAPEAVELGAVDLLAEDRDQLLDSLDGLEVMPASGGPVTLETADARVERYEVSFFREVLQVLADPNIAFLLMSVGTLGLIYELAAPGGGAAGVLGVGMIVLALFSLSVIPIDATGFIFLAVAVGCFLAEVFAPGIGIFAVLGAASLAMAGLFLFDEEAPGFSLSLAAVLPTVVVVGGAVVLAGQLAVRSQRQVSASGLEHLIGRETVVAGASGRAHQALVEGAWWRVRPTSGELEEGQRVRVTGIEDLDLVVEPIEATATERKQS